MQLFIYILYYIFILKLYIKYFLTYYLMRGVHSFRDKKNKKIKFLVQTVILFLSLNVRLNLIFS